MNIRDGVYVQSSRVTCLLAFQTDTFRKFKELLQQQPSTCCNFDRGQENEDPDKLSCRASVGDRCRVQPGERRGTVQFVGPVAGLAEGVWVGVEYDEPLGKNDGSVNGVRYFECTMGYGSFMRPSKVEVGSSQADRERERERDLVQNRIGSLEPARYSF